MSVKTKLDIRNALNNHMRGKSVPAEFQSALSTQVNEDGAFLIPEELKSDITIAKRHNKSMSQFVHVIPVKNAKGIYSDEDENNNNYELIDFDTDIEITEQTLKLKGVSWNLKSKGSFTPISEPLYEDAAYDLFEHFKNAHAEKATKTENKMIFTSLRESLVAKQLTNVVDLKLSLNKDLNPALDSEIVIVTNQDGYEIFNKLDSNGDPIKYFYNEGPKRYFDIYRFEVFSNDDLPSVNGKAPFIYGAFKRSVKLFTADKVGVLLVKNPYGLRDRKHIMRGVEELDIKVMPDTTQVIFAEMPIGVV